MPPFTKCSSSEAAAQHVQHSIPVIPVQPEWGGSRHGNPQICSVPPRQQDIFSPSLLTCSAAPPKRTDSS